MNLYNLYLRYSPIILFKDRITIRLYHYTFFYGLGLCYITRKEPFSWLDLTWKKTSPMYSPALLDASIGALGSRFKRLQRCEANAMLTISAGIPSASWVCWYEMSNTICHTKPHSNPTDAVQEALRTK